MICPLVISCCTWILKITIFNSKIILNRSCSISSILFLSNIEQYLEHIVEFGIPEFAKNTSPQLLSTVAFFCTCQQKVSVPADTVHFRLWRPSHRQQPLLFRSFASGGWRSNNNILASLTELGCDRLARPLAVEIWIRRWLCRGGRGLLRGIPQRSKGLPSPETNFETHMKTITLFLLVQNVGAKQIPNCPNQPAANLQNPLADRSVWCAVCVTGTINAQPLHWIRQLDPASDHQKTSKRTMF